MKYDHTKLKAGDPVVYGGQHGGWGYGQFVIHKTKVERLTATQIIMEDGARFRRSDGRKVGSDSHVLLDPKGKQVRDAMGALESSAFGYALTQWDKQRRGVKTLEGWEICLSQLEALVASAQRQIRDIKEEME
jgi:hypothetical protein